MPPKSIADWRGLFEPSSAMHFTERERAPQTLSSPAAPNHDNLPPGRKTHIHTSPPRPLACGGVLTCLTKIFCRDSQKIKIYGKVCMCGIFLNNNEVKI